MHNRQELRSTISARQRGAGGEHQASCNRHMTSAVIFACWQLLLATQHSCACCIAVDRHHKRMCMHFGLQVTSSRRALGA